MDTIKSTIKSSFDEETKITKYTWSIYANDIAKFRDLPNASHAQSELFTSNQTNFTNLKWNLRCYPNGTNKNSVGSCKMFLRLKSIPKEYSCVKAYYYIRCLETDSCIENVNEFTKTTDFSGWNSGTMLTSDLRSKQCTSSITFEAGIRILKIIDINNLIIYSYSLPILSICKQYKVEWFMNRHLLNTLRKSHNGKWICGTLLSSTNHMFSIACCPNGEKENDKGYVSLFFIILSFPNTIESMKINFTLSCLQLNKSKTETYIFCAEKYSRGWPRFATINQLLNINKMDVICVADIIEMYDKNGNVVSNSTEQKEEEIIKPKPKQLSVIKNFNVEIISELVNLGVGTKEECVAASLLVINQNDINEVKDKVSELQQSSNKTIKSPTTVIESGISGLRLRLNNSNSNNKRFKYIPRQSVDEPVSPMISSPIPTLNNNNNNKIYSTINCSFDIETKIFKLIWRINENDIQKFKELQTGQFVQSSQFNTDINVKNCNENIKWILRCYPNGMNATSFDSCKMYLCCTNIKSMCVAVYYYIRCIETATCTEFIREFSKHENNSGWKTRRQLSNELQKIKTITFECGIRILKITDAQTKNIMYKYPLQLSLIRHEYQLSWYINHELLSIFKTSHCCKSIDATLINNKNQMFSIQCYPNGYDEQHKGFLSLYFIVVSFPIGVYAMKIKFKLKCSKLKYIKQYIFSQQKYGRGWDKFCVAKSAYLNVNEINITCDVEIIELYDKDSNIITTTTGGGGGGGMMNSIKYERKIANLQEELYKYKKLMQKKTNTIQTLHNTINKTENDKKILHKRFDDIAQANVRQRSTIQRRKTLTDSHQQINTQLREQILSKDDEIMKLKSKNIYLNKRINYLNNNNNNNNNNEVEQKDNDLFQILTDLNNLCDEFKGNYNQKILRELLINKELKNVIQNTYQFNDYNNNIENIIIAFEIFEKYIKDIKIYLKMNLIKQNVNQYKKWDLSQIILWIMQLENGKYIKYCHKLCKGFKDSDINTGNVLPELTRQDLSNPPFNMNEFVIKRDLEKHFKSLGK